MKSLTILGWKRCTWARPDPRHSILRFYPGAAEIVPELLPEPSPPLEHARAACPGPSPHFCRSTQSRGDVWFLRKRRAPSAPPRKPRRAPAADAQHLHLLLSSAAFRGCTWASSFCLQNIYTSPWRRRAAAGLGGVQDPVPPVHPGFSAAGPGQEPPLSFQPGLFCAADANEAPNVGERGFCECRDKPAEGEGAGFQQQLLSPMS